MPFQKRAGLSTGEIAEILGISQGGVNQILKRSLRKMRRHISSEAVAYLSQTDRPPYEEEYVLEGQVAKRSKLLL